MNDLFVSWQDPEKRHWYPVGRLMYRNQVYRFVYTVGAEKAESFSPFFAMRNLNKIYESEELFPIFSNRLMSSSRPEYSNLIDWLSLENGDVDPFVILSLTGGIRKTDSLEIFPCPTTTPEGNYELKFFSRGLSHEPESTKKRADQLRFGEKLFLMKDVQNKFDHHALVLRTDDPVTIVGYCPRYLVSDLNELLDKNGPDNVHVTVDKVNPDAPFQLRLLCKIVSPWPEGFRACSTELYHSLVPDSEVDSNCS